MKTNLIKTVAMAIMIALVAGLVGCVGAITKGKKFDETMVAQIQKGVTTQDNIVSMFGEPVSTRKTDKGEVFSYTMYEANALMPDHEQSLDVYFNKKGVVTDYKHSSANPIFH